MAKGAGWAKAKSYNPANPENPDSDEGRGLGAVLWIPAFAGMTRGEGGNDGVRAGMTVWGGNDGVGAGMTGVSGNDSVGAGITEGEREWRAALVARFSLFSLKIAVFFNIGMSPGRRP